MKGWFAAGIAYVMMCHGVAARGQERIPTPQELVERAVASERWIDDVEAMHFVAVIHETRSAWFVRPRRPLRYVEP